MTEEAIKQAEEELKSQSPTKVKRAQIGFNKSELKPAAESEKGKENEPTEDKTETKSSPTKDDDAVCCIEIVGWILVKQLKLSGFSKTNEIVGFL